MLALVNRFVHGRCPSPVDWKGVHKLLKNLKVHKATGPDEIPEYILKTAAKSTKEVAYKTLVRPKLEYAVPIWSPYLSLQINQVEKSQRTAARWTCRRWQNTSSVSEMLDELEWPSLEARRDRSSLLLFHKIHSGAVSIKKDKYLTPAHSLKSTRASHCVQYCRYQTYSDALKNSFFPQTISQWNGLSPSVVNSQTTEEFRALLI